MGDLKERIAKRAAQELKDGDVVNLGIGLPTMVADFVPKDVEIILHSENGLLGMGGTPTAEELDLDVQNAGAQFITAKPGAMFFDSATSFGMIRGGHLDVTILGAFQVDEQGNLANWMVPDGKISGMGGAMDLSVGAKRVIVTMLHTGKHGSKLVKQCSYPLTALRAVDLVITEMGVFRLKPEGGFELTECFADYSPEEIQKNTDCVFSVSDSLKINEVDG